MKRRKKTSDISVTYEKAAQALEDGDLLLILAGAGFSADSGLATYDSIASNPMYSSLGLDYADLCDTAWLAKDPDIFFGFWGNCYNSYVKAKPHPGYSILSNWCEKFRIKKDNWIESLEDDERKDWEVKRDKMQRDKEKGNSTRTIAGQPSVMQVSDKFHPSKHIHRLRIQPQPYFIATSNVDGIFEKSGMFSKSSFVEIHGSCLDWQCSLPCCEKVWRLNLDFQFYVDKHSLRAPKVIKIDRRSLQRLSRSSKHNSRTSSRPGSSLGSSSGRYPLLASSSAISHFSHSMRASTVLMKTAHVPHSSIVEDVERRRMNATFVTPGQQLAAFWQSGTSSRLNGASTESTHSRATPVSRSLAARMRMMYQTDAARKQQKQAKLGSDAATKLKEQFLKSLEASIQSKKPSESPTLAADGAEEATKEGKEKEPEGIDLVLDGEYTRAKFCAAITNSQNNKITQPDFVIFDEEEEERKAQKKLKDDIEAARKAIRKMTPAELALQSALASSASADISSDSSGSTSLDTFRRLRKQTLEESLAPKRDYRYGDDPGVFGGVGVGDATVTPDVAKTAPSVTGSVKVFDNREIEYRNQPACPSCGRLARPNVLMFDDGKWLDADDTHFKRWKRYATIVCGGKGGSKTAIRDDEMKNIVILEIGCGLKVPTLRRLSEKLCTLLGERCSLIRINPNHTKFGKGRTATDEPDGMAGRFFPIKATGLEALQAIDKKWERLVYDREMKSRRGKRRGKRF
ncbi:hypothetical protein ADUPG1_010515 [Aduncisulcus paluster]|uniref:Deacetylase sirtuin-type domain-containing protein n=1 Tax=Aduncisulcus paluster TaxID=2918883 RepID=A0ABQ5JS55_9EUKA|nr:hypothetical protein ADUPG1_010515 [Aduncisulcus paluster]